MLHMRLGEDPEWALVRSRERLDYTDPPLGPPDRGRGLIARRTVLAVASALAITAILPADSTPSPPAALAGPGSPADHAGHTTARSSARTTATGLAPGRLSGHGPAGPAAPREIVHRALGRTHPMQRNPR